MIRTSADPVRDTATHHPVIVDELHNVTACRGCGLHVFTRPGGNMLTNLFALEHGEIVGTVLPTPTPCPSCGGPRTLERDMGGDHDVFLWCEVCSDATPDTDDHHARPCGHPEDLCPPPGCCTDCGTPLTTHP